MSEYQYYEFRAVDRALTRQEQEELRRLSSRAEITALGFTNTYNYGDFRGNPDALMDRYFDAFVYVSNFGSLQLKLRIPSRLLDADTVTPYTDEDFLTVRGKGQDIILAFDRNEDPGGDWVDGEGWMERLVGLRDELMRGDHRALYLGWLGSFAGRGWVDGVDLDDCQPTEGEVEPPVPPGLLDLSDSLDALVEFLGIDPNLIAAAARGSPARVAVEPTPIELARWLRGLPVAHKDFLLLRLLNDEGAVPLRAEMLRDFRAETGRPGEPTARSRRTVDQLLQARGEQEAESQRREAERIARERAARERAEADARDQRLRTLARREEAAWAEADALIATKLPKKYDQALALLGDLVELARRDGRAAEVEARLRDIRLRHAGKPSLIRRLDGMPGR